jgi:hypothetical protein
MKGARIPVEGGVGVVGMREDDGRGRSGARCDAVLVCSGGDISRSE